MAHEPDRGFAQKDLTGRSYLLQARRDVYRVPCDEIITAGDHLTAVYACTNGKGDAPVVLEFPVQRLQALHHLDRRANGPQRVIFMKRRYAEYGHHGIADELLNGPSVPFQHRAHLCEIAGHDAPKGFGIQALSEMRRSDDVREEDGNGLADFPGCSRRQQPLATSKAELRAVGILLPAAGTRHHRPRLRRLGGPIQPHS